MCKTTVHSRRDDDVCKQAFLDNICETFSLPFHSLEKLIWFPSSCIKAVKAGKQLRDVLAKLCDKDV